MGRSSASRTRLAQALARALHPAEEQARLARIDFEDAGHGYDRFGLHPAWVAAGAGLFRVFYERYFRVDSRGAENIPREGPAILVANHSGTVPIDGLMLYLDVLRRTDPPRVLRAIGDRFIPALPVISTLFARTGTVSGTRENLRALLAHGELVLIFPEGTPGVGKPFHDRYHLLPFRVGHVETAIACGAPIIPAAVIGAEEQWPQVARLPIQLFGAPYLPLPLTPFPLPVRYHLRYGAPIRFDAPPSAATRPEVLREGAARVQAAVEALIAEGLREREGIFT
ncbi:MAG: lysophospholipid acyltransferase family protein [Byssovorax sp.]